ncbi:EamA family transporter [Kiritimatiellaeota bacterium B1221]|nr:EamA family transporter [Kiritimatiellaeota bacterium B1221]
MEIIPHHHIAFPNFYSKLQPIMPHTPTKKTLIPAFLAVYFIWGSTYLGIKMVVATLPPLTFSGLRFIIAGAFLYTFLRLRGATKPQPVHWRNAFIGGTLLILGGNAIISIAAQWIDSGLIAVLTSINPLYMTFIGWWTGQGKRPGWISLVALGIGILGIGLLVSPEAHGEHLIAGCLLSVLAPGLWATGALIGKACKQPDSSLTFAAMQMLCGGLMTLAVALISGEAFHANWSAASAQSWWAFAYLVVIGSWVGFSSFIYITKHTPPILSSSYSYINPIVAVLLGKWFLDEPLNPTRLLGMVLTLTAVGTVLWRNSKRQ